MICFENRLRLFSNLFNESKRPSEFLSRLINHMSEIQFSWYFIYNPNTRMKAMFNLRPIYLELTKSLTRTFVI